MSSETKKVLEMLSEGKITAEDAERLLAKLAGSASQDGDAASGGGDSGFAEERGTPVESSVPRTRSPLKYLRVKVDSSDGDKVNIRVPLALVRTGLKLSTMMPAHANEKLTERGIDLSQLSGLEGEELLEALRELQVDVDSTDGDTVRIFCE